MRNRVKPAPIATSRSTKNFSCRTWEEDHRIVKLSHDFMEIMIDRYNANIKPLTIKLV